MEQSLIHRMWEHTHHIEQFNRERSHLIDWESYDFTKSNLPHHMPASLFFPAASYSALFMSFHNESSNLDKHYHDFFELIYVCKGTPIGVINDQELYLKEGQLCIMNPNAVHYFKKYKEENDLILNIVLPKDLFQKSIFRTLFNDPVLNVFFIRYRLENANHPSYFYLQQLDKSIDYLVEMLVREYLEKKQYSRVIIESLLTLTFSFILRKFQEESSRRSSTLSDITDYIYLNYQSVTMEQIADQFNYHPKYLSSLIHKHTGQTFRSLLVSIKLQNSINYLIYSDYTIEQIVDLIGYKDKSSFYSQFKKEYGMSPAQYRLQYS